MHKPRLYKNVNALDPIDKGAVVAIGNFDGVHLGHQSIIKSARTYADDKKTNLGIMLFDPHPRAYFSPDAPPFRLSRIETRLRLFADLGVDFVLALDFDQAMASLSAQDFITRILYDALRISGLSVGFNFRFGKGRTGTVDILQAAGKTYNFECFSGVAVTDAAGNPYSSSAIRAYLRAGDMEQAHTALGRAWTIEGIVAKGDQRGHTIGFATANIELGDYLHPAFGVYTIRAHIIGRDLYKFGVANIGIRPTVGTPAPRLEAHLFDFNDDIYGETLHIELLKFIRPEQKFDGLESLRAQIAKDSDAARAYLAGLALPTT